MAVSFGNDCGRRFSNRLKLALISVVSVTLLGCGQGDTDRHAASVRETTRPEASLPDVTAPDNTAASTETAATRVAAATQDPTTDPSMESTWGHLRGRFVYDGAAPQQKALPVNKDVEYCGQHRPLDESLVVNSENGGLANVVIQLYVKRGSQPPSIHESYSDTAGSEVTMDNLHCRFEPHIVLLRTSQTFLVRNNDTVGHNTKIETTANASSNDMTPAGGSVSHQFVLPERGPAGVSCSIHPWMTAWVVVADTPYMAVSDKDGNFEIPNLPAGDITFRVWHETARYITKVTVAGSETTWKKGRFTHTINSAVNELGEIMVNPELFD